MQILAVTAGCVEMLNNPADIFWLVNNKTNSFYFVILQKLGVYN